MDAGRMCEETGCCDYGDANNMETECCMCSKLIIPREEHDKSFEEQSELYNNYYGSDLDDGDICYECLKKIMIYESI